MTLVDGPSSSLCVILGAIDIEIRVSHGAY